LEQLAVSREEVKVTVLREGRSGILGLGAEEVRIKVEPLMDTFAESGLRPEEIGDVAKVAEGALETLLTMMGVAASVVLHQQKIGDEEGEVAPITLDINGDDLGILIGRRGQTLSCLQYIVRLIVGRQTESWVPIIIDVEGYKQRRYETLRALAQRMAEQVEADGVPFTLEPMLAYERRIVHLALAEHPDVATQSIGEGEARRVVIQPKGEAEA